MNSVNLIGRLTKDVEMKYTPNGVALSTFTLAVNRPFKNENGEYDADFIRVQAWRKRAENVANYCKKGSQVAVTGRIQTSSFEGQDGKMVYMTEVAADSIGFLDTRNGKGDGSSHRNQQPNFNQSHRNQPSQDPFRNQGGTVAISESDLPF